MLERLTQFFTRLVLVLLIAWAGMQLVSPAIPFLLVGLVLLHLLVRLTRRS